MSVRGDVADAIDAAGIEGVSGGMCAPPTRAAGVAWAQWAATTPRQQTSAGVRTVTEWDVLVILPAEHPAVTASAADEWLPALLDALSPLGILGQATPIQLVLGDGLTTPALQIKLTTN